MPGGPERIGKFKIEGLLGRGAMGVVYRAHDPDIERTVAIKLVRTDLLEGDDHDHYVARFRNEARMVGRCIHPNIIGIYDFALHEGDPFLVLEFLEGTDLGRRLRSRGWFEVEAATMVALRVLDALAYAHRFGIVHRDIKPANILLTPELNVKVTDFGISRALTSSSTMSSVLVGTPCYMSPEQCLGSAVDERSDLFSLGCVLYEALSGERAFSGPNYVATTHRILHDTPRALHELRPDLPPALTEVVERALRKEAGDRFQTADDMAMALRAALQPLGGDETVVLQKQADASHAEVKPRIQLFDNISPASLVSIERELAHHLGPIVRIHLRDTLRRARSPDELVQQLAALIPQGAERDRLARLFGEILAGDRPGSGAISEAELNIFFKALTTIMGPIAPRLIQRSMRTARTPEELEAACLELINSVSGREQFRKLLLAGSRPGLLPKSRR